jgi:hypothetical protein
MTKPELIALCENFKPGDRKTFQAIITGFTDMDPDNTYVLCEEFEIAPTTISRWKNDICRPHPNIQCFIVRFITGQDISCQDVAGIFELTGKDLNEMLPPEFKRLIRAAKQHIENCAECRKNHQDKLTALRTRND